MSLHARTSRRAQAYTRPFALSVCLKQHNETHSWRGKHPRVHISTYNVPAWTRAHVALPLRVLLAPGVTWAGRIVAATVGHRARVALCAVANWSAHGTTLYRQWSSESGETALSLIRRRLIGIPILSIKRAVCVCPSYGFRNT